MSKEEQTRALGQANRARKNSRGGGESRPVPHLVGKENQTWVDRAVKPARRNGQESGNGHEQRSASHTGSEFNDQVCGAVRGASVPSPPISVERSGSGKRISPKAATDPSAGESVNLERRAKAVGPHSQQAGVASGPRELKKGRPRLGEVRDKPWEKTKPPMSKTTWYRRRKETQQ
jgi:hypothetical protein